MSLEWTLLLRVKESRTMHRRLVLVSLALAGCASLTTTAWAYPEFQEFTEKNSSRSTNCAMCHINANGPVGDGEGQLGSLSDKELERLNRARSALEPGQEVDSPILNEFGNHIIKELGKSKFLELKKDPGKLVEVLGDKSDLDGDGIPDSREYAAGTDPLNKFHGDPWLLFVNNLKREQAHVVLAVVATLALVFGLANFIRGLHVLTDRKSGSD